MNTGYLELVGLQVTFDNVLPEYKLVHYYRKIQVLIPNPVVKMRGYEMELTEDPKEIVGGLRKVWKPVVLSIWNQDTVLTSSEYLQFHIGGRPDELGLEGEWKLRPPE